MKVFGTEIYQARIYQIDLKLPSTELLKGLDKLNLVEFAHAGIVLGSSQFFLLPQLPQNMPITSKAIKIDLKIIN